jgi:hypothetical protein
MFAKNARELRKLIQDHPEESPSLFLRDDSFAAHCYDNRTPKALKSAFHRDADPEECWKWRLTAVEWKENIEMALIALNARSRRL